MEGPCDRAEVKLYSPSFSQVAHQGFGPQPAGWDRLELGGGVCRGLAPGLYYCSVTAHRGWDSSAAALTKVMILR
jgi:hypothetical protein